MCATNYGVVLHAAMAETAEIEFAESTVYFNLRAKLSFSSKCA